MLRATMSTRAPARGGALELLDDRGVGERVHLEPDLGPLAGSCRGGNLANQLHEPWSQGQRRDEQLAELLRHAEPGEVVEEVGDVSGDVLVGREEADVLVGPRRDRVVVAGSDMDVAPEPVVLAPDDERRLGVDLQVREPVDDVDAGLLEGVRPLDVPPLVEARLQLDEADALLAGLGGGHERRHDRRLVARPVHGRLEGANRRVDGRRADVLLEARRERVVRVLDEDVGAADLGEDVAVLERRAQPGLGRRPPRLVLQLGPVQSRELGHLREVEQAVDLVHLLVGDAEVGPEPLAHRGRHRGRDLDADDVAEATLADLGPHRLEEVVGIVRELHVGVAGDAEDRALEDLHAGEEGAEVVRDHLLEG